jgi:serine protease Do
MEVSITEQPNPGKAAAASTKQGKGSEGRFGLSFQDLSPELIERFGYQGKQGVLVSKVAEGSPAEEAGMHPGQLVEEINKKPVRNFADLQAELKNLDDQKRLLLKVRTGNSSQYVALALE